MNKRVIRSLLTAVLAVMSVCSIAANAPKEDRRVYEAYVKSLHFQSAPLANIVIRPCDQKVVCENIFASMDSRTVWRDDGVEISYADAKKLNWIFALVAVDKKNHVLMVNRIITGSEK